jgi:pyruvate dehydrogenase E2 component (dihydrolipoamide acetyltransferase)
VVRNGALAVARVMTLELSCDHRVVDGAVGGRFLAGLRERLEEGSF